MHSIKRSSLLFLCPLNLVSVTSLFGFPANTVAKALFRNLHFHSETSTSWKKHYVMEHKVATLNALQRKASRQKSNFETQQTFCSVRKWSWKTEQQSPCIICGILCPPALQVEPATLEPSGARRSPWAVPLGGPGFATGELCRSPVPRLPLHGMTAGSLRACSLHLIAGCQENLQTFSQKVHIVFWDLFRYFFKKKKRKVLCKIVSSLVVTRFMRFGSFPCKHCRFKYLNSIWFHKFTK